VDLVPLPEDNLENVEGMILACLLAFPPKLGGLRPQIAAQPFFLSTPH
jgi:hypothetical protein